MDQALNLALKTETSCIKLLFIGVYKHNVQPGRFFNTCSGLPGTLSSTGHNQELNKYSTYFGNTVIKL